jgi:hypothetical protein
MPAETVHLSVDFVGALTTDQYPLISQDIIIIFYYLYYFLLYLLVIITFINFIID